MNWNILVTLGIKIKWDSLSFKIKLKKSLKSKMEIKICLNLGKPFSKAKYDI